MPDHAARQDRTVSWILGKPVIVGLAVLGGLASLAVMILRSRPTTRCDWLDQLNRLAYLFMGMSVVLFIVKGFVNP